MPTQELQQRQILSQQQLQALNILSLDGAALDEMLKKEEIDNPLFDLDKIHGTVERPISVQTPDKEGDLSERAAPDKTAQDLYLFLESQLPANATKAERGVFRHMVEFLEPGTGLLPETVEEVAEILAAPLYVVERCLSWLHQMEPAGVGAATTSESLVLQAFHKGMTDPTLLGILFDHLEDVAAKGAEAVDAVSGATLVDTAGYLSAIVDAAKNAQTTQAVEFNGSSEDLKLNVVYGAAHGTKCFTSGAVATAGDTIVLSYIDEFQFAGSDAGVVGVPNSDSDFGAGYAEGKVLMSKRVNADYYSKMMAEKAGSTVSLDANYDAIQNHVNGMSIADAEALSKDEKAVDAVSGATLVDTAGYVGVLVDAAK